MAYLISGDLKNTQIIKKTWSLASFCKAFPSRTCTWLRLRAGSRSGVWGEREDSRRGWKHWSEYHTGECLGWFGAEREVRENTGQWNKNQ